MTTICRKATLLVFVVSLLVPPPAWAGGQLYMLSPNAPFWSDASMPVPYNLNLDSASGCIEGPHPEQQFIDAAEAAFRTWEEVPTSRI
ncbi:MAG: hypothetical protein ACWGSD_17260, partial [Thermodesulfobacteriota bacterium]